MGGVGLFVYFQMHPQKQKTKVKAPKAYREHRSSPRGLGERPETTREERRRQPRKTATFNSVGWEAEIEEFLQQVSPTSSSDAMLQALVQVTKRDVLPIVPEARITAFSNVNL